MPKPALVLVPGAWHTPQAFEKIIPKLEAKGFDCFPLSLPSVGMVPPVKDLEADIQTVRRAVTELCEAERDVAVVSHSWGGLPVNSALDGLSKAEMTSNGAKAGVVKLIFLCAFVVPVGISVFDALGQKVPDLWRIEGDITFANGPEEAFYNDLDPEEAKYYSSLLKSHSLATKYTKSISAAWQNISSSYLICEKDNAIPTFAQDGMVAAIREAGGDLSVERMDASHSPFLSKPDEVVDFIVRSLEN